MWRMLVVESTTYDNGVFTFFRLEGMDQGMKFSIRADGKPQDADSARLWLSMGAVLYV